MSAVEYPADPNDLPLLRVHWQTDKYYRETRSLFVSEMSYQQLIDSNVCHALNREPMRACVGNGTWPTDETRAVLRDGWPKGLRKIQEFRAAIDRELPQPTSRRRRLVWADDGEEPDIDKLLAGVNDTAFRTAKRVRTAHPPVIDIYSGLGGAWMQSAEQLFWAGASACVVTDELERAGYAVRLIGVYTGRFYRDGRDGMVALQVLLKEAHEPVCLEMIAAVLCDANIFRSHFFSAICRVPIAIDTALGSIVTWKEAIPFMREAGELDESAVHLYQMYDQQSAAKQVKEVLSQFCESEESYHAA